MVKEELQGKLENLKIQQNQLENTYNKIQGAIEFCEALLAESEEEKPSENGKIVTEKEKVKVK